MRSTRYHLRRGEPAGIDLRSAAATVLLYGAVPAPYRTRSAPPALGHVLRGAGRMLRNCAEVAGDPASGPVDQSIGALIESIEHMNFMRIHGGEDAHQRGAAARMRGQDQAIALQAGETERRRQPLQPEGDQ